ncbi:MAG: 4'-phosphopantetheinyl transferase superfamily protein [Bacteroidetes bacterium]|nr:4'-phosphopantetheinyl transferase superfamily protein [Bacteroidota bacterium]
MTSPKRKRVGGDEPSALFASLPHGAPPLLVVRWTGASWLDAEGPCLSDAEAAEAAAMGAVRREAFVLGRTLARRTMAEVLGVPPLAVPLARDADGRPLVPEHILSLTHTRIDGQAVAGVALANVAVGLDVEPVRPRAAGLEERILADGEALPDWPTSEAARLLAAWTAKEAVLKADGLGLRQGARAARIAWGNPEGEREAKGGAFTATSPNGRWAGQGVEQNGLVWAVAWAATL